MSFTQKTLNLFHRKAYQGLTHQPKVTALAGTVRSGRFVFLGLTFEQDRVAEARYRTFPCLSAIAAAEWTCEWVQGLDWSEVSVLKSSDIEDGLGGLPLSRRFCCDLVLKALQDACNTAREQGLLS